MTADGRSLWIIHGDHFDAVVQCAKWLAYLGDNLYEFTLRLNRHLNSLRARMGLPYWSLSAYLKQKVKTALNYVTDFEEAVASEARRRGHQGVVCGHIHRAFNGMFAGHMLTATPATSMSGCASSSRRSPSRTMG